MVVLLLHDLRARRPTDPLLHNEHRHNSLPPASCLCRTHPPSPPLPSPPPPRPQHRGSVSRHCPRVCPTPSPCHPHWPIAKGAQNLSHSQAFSLTRPYLHTHTHTQSTGGAEGQGSQSSSSPSSCLYLFLLLLLLLLLLQLLLYPSLLPLLRVLLPPLLRLRLV